MLNTRMYEVDFAGGEVTELTISVTNESMNTQCEADVNEYLLLDVIVDYQKENKVISLPE